MAEEVGGDDRRLKMLDCVVINFPLPAPEKVGDEPCATIPGLKWGIGKAVVVGQRNRHRAWCESN
jgi:hypothetical protein